MIKVNLVPAEILAKARQRQLLMQAGIIGGVFLVLVLLVSLGHYYSLFRLQNEFKYKESKLKELAAVVAQVEELEKASAAVRARLNVIEDLLKGRAFYPLFMSEFARTVPGGVKVTALTTASQSSSSLKLSITGTAGSNQDIATWVRTLQGDTNFSGVELGAVNASGTGYSFTIQTTYTLKL